MSFLFPQIFAWLSESLTEPFVWGCWGERGRQSVRGREKKREEGGKGDTTATICSMWPSLFSIRAAIHGMVLLITAHNTFSGMAHNLPVARWTSRVTSGRVHVYIQYVYTYVLGLGKCAQTAYVNVHVIACRHALMLVYEYVHLFECVWDFAWAFHFEGVFAQCVRGLWWGGAGGQAGKLRQLLESLQGVCRATAQVPRTSGWMSWRRVMGSHWAYDVKANLMSNC